MKKIVVIVVLGLFFSTESIAQLDANQLIRVHNVTNASDMNNISSPHEGCVVYVDSENTIYVYDGIQWVNAFSSSSSSDGWKMTGNISSQTELLGTTNNEDFRIRTNNIQRMVIKNDGKVGVNLDNPSGIFQVNTAGPTSNTIINGTASSNASSQATAPYLAHDNNASTHWNSIMVANQTVNFWFKIDLGANNAQVVNKYRIDKRVPDEHPTNWEFQGSNDNINWTDLHFRHEATTWWWGPSITQTFTNTTAYRYYRWFMHRGYNNGSGWSYGYSIREFSLFLAGDTDETNLSDDFIITNNGNVGIGINPTQKLHVEGNVLASSYSTPDYVFEKYYNGKSKLNPSYEFMEIESVEEFVRKNKHLPGIPSAKVVEEKGGIIVNKSIEQNLEKIEELYLRLFELNATHEKLKARLQELKKNNPIK